MSAPISATVTAGKPIVAPLVVSKQIDSATPKILDALGRGRLLSNVVVSATGVGNPQPVRARYAMKDVRVVDYRLVDNLGAPATEQVSFAASNVTIEYIPVDQATGRPLTPIVGSINPAGL